MISTPPQKFSSINFIRRTFSTKMLAKMSHNWLRTMTLITNPLTTIRPCMARGKFCAMQSSFQIRIEFMMNTVIAMITVIIKVTTVTILLPP